MSFVKKAKLLATQLNVTIEDETFNDSHDIQVAAPDNMQWQDGQCIHLVESYYSYIKGSKETAYSIIYHRMLSGLEPIDNNINPQ